MTDVLLELTSEEARVLLYMLKSERDEHLICGTYHRSLHGQQIKAMLDKLGG